MTVTPPATARQSGVVVLNYTVRNDSAGVS